MKMLNALASIKSYIVAAKDAVLAGLEKLSPVVEYLAQKIAVHPKTALVIVIILVVAFLVKP